MLQFSFSCFKMRTGIFIKRESKIMKCLAILGLIFDDHAFISGGEGEHKTNKLDDVPKRINDYSYGRCYEN